MTLNEMATAIRNHVVDGLNGVDTLPFSIEQLQKEILISVPGVLLELSSKGVIDLLKLTQRIDGIRLHNDDVSGNCSVDSGSCAPHFEIPNVNRFISEPITFIGSMDSRISFKIYYDRDWRFHKYRLATANKPFAWVSTRANSNGLYDIFLFNLGKYSGLKYISIDALFDNPYDIFNTPYFEQFSAAEFYAPSVVQETVIDKLTKKYIDYYRKLHMIPKPNTQA